MHTLPQHHSPANDYYQSFPVSERQVLMDRVNVASYPWCVCVGVIDALFLSHFVLGSRFQTLRLLDDLNKLSKTVTLLPYS